jgi:uncharacterized glyoxalase superfamily protein PhnB
MPTEIIPYLIYRDVPAAIGFLSRAFGFTEDLRESTPSGGIHAQMRLDGCRIMMGQGGEAWKMLPPADPTVTAGIFVYIPDVDAHYERARTAGAEIVHPPKDVEYGRTYTARDPDGHPWFFTTAPT